MANIDESIIRNIVREADFPTERLLLSLLPCYKELMDDEGRRYQGIFFLKSLYPCDNWIDINSNYLIKEWEYGISITGHICNQQKQFPAYFAYVLGHELGHAHICDDDRNLHIHSCLISLHIAEASKCKIPENHELPHEKRCDQFGIYIAEQIYSRKKLNDEIGTLMAKRECNDHERLGCMLSLQGTTDLKNIKNELVDLSIPFKTELIKLLEKDKQKSTSGCPLLAKEIPDFEILFK
jgi:hypothetical protein